MIREVLNHIFYKLWELRFSFLIIAITVIIIGIIIWLITSKTNNTEDEK